ncbi:hypothetical protein NEF87_003518 [Candidatus Lokiarchaeum ossiferum]|uniref:SCP2 domain-containing protein n=1 Tax=Candidatus Lokiarchaeum ossiferum TaxID=2951803 RepID=A0ABY6HUN1_9ARCH|nr:hypothetical protein NEF87_003518 [Candidatus Lokiarchaeum sp. B-35]
MGAKELVEKWENDTFTAADVDEFLTVAAEFGNSNEDIQEELEDMGDKSYLFKVEGMDDFWLKIEGGKLSAGKGSIDSPSLTYSMKEDICVGVLSGKMDSTAVYMKGDLKIEGSLKDGANFVSLLEMLREEMEEAD